MVLMALQKSVSLVSSCKILMCRTYIGGAGGLQRWSVASGSSVASALE